MKSKSAKRWDRFLALAILAAVFLFGVAIFNSYSAMSEAASSEERGAALFRLCHASFALLCSVGAVLSLVTWLNWTCSTYGYDICHYGIWLETWQEWCLRLLVISPIVAIVVVFVVLSQSNQDWRAFLVRTWWYPIPLWVLATPGTFTKHGVLQQVTGEMPRHTYPLRCWLDYRRRLSALRTPADCVTELLEIRDGGEYDFSVNRDKLFLAAVKQLIQTFPKVPQPFESSANDLVSFLLHAEDYVRHWTDYRSCLKEFMRDAATVSQIVQQALLDEKAELQSKIAKEKARTFDDHWDADSWADERRKESHSAEVVAELTKELEFLDSCIPSQQPPAEPVA